MIDRSLIKYALVKELYKYWENKHRESKAQSRLPRRADIRPEELKALAGYVFMVDVLKEPLQFKVRFFGSRLVEWAGRDYTGAVISEADYGHWRQVFHDYQAVVETRAPRLDERRAEWAGKEFHGYERFVAPLFGEGGTVEMLFGALHVHRQLNGKL